MRRALPLLLAAALACADTDDAPAPPVAGEPSADSATLPRDTATVFASRIAIFLLADSVELAYLRGEYGADYETVADDMMWYRAEAIGFFEKNDIPTVWYEGRRPLRFRVRGFPQQHDFGDLDFADVVVLYEPDSVPRAVAPVDVPSVAPEYFGLE